MRKFEKRSRAGKIEVLCDIALIASSKKRSHAGKSGGLPYFCSGWCAKALVFFGSLQIENMVAKKLARVGRWSAGVAESGGEGFGEWYPPPPPRDSRKHIVPDVNSHRYAGQHIR